MDKYEYKLKAEEIRTLAANKQYIEAMQIADAIDWRRVKSVMMLNVVSEIYKMNRRYEDSKEILLLAYERHPGGRSILYSLCELSIKMEEFVQAVEYYKEFVQAAPRDMGRYILQYKLYEAQEVSLEERISVLEEFKRRDYREKWAYELAFLYHRIGLSTKCVEECDELILWFGEGKYVTKAMELKMLHEPLTPAQMEKYEKGKRKKKAAASGYEPEQEIAEEDEMDIQVKPIDMGQYNTINLQQELAASMQELMENSQEGDTSDAIADAVVAPLLQETAEIHLYNRPIQRDGQEVFFEDDGYEYTDTGELPQEYEEEVFLEEMPEEFYEEEVFNEENYEEETYEETYIEEYSQEEMFEEPALNKMLSQEYDGQITLVVPEAEQLEKQITGQMSIEDILLEWEKMKKENEEKRKEDVRQRVLEQTSELFSEFDASAKADIMEDLNRLAEKTMQTSDMQEIFQEEASQEELPQPEYPDAEEELTEAEELAEVIAEEILEEEYYEEVPEGEEYYEEAPESEEYYEEAPESEEYYEEAPEGEEYYEEAPEGGEYYEEAPEGGEYYEEVPEGEEYYEEAPEAKEYYEEVKGLSNEQEKLFGSFIGSDKNRVQIEDALDKISLAAYTGNIIVTGDMGTGTLTLAKNLIKEIQNTDGNFSGKVAKVSGEALNKRNINETVSRLKNGALLVEKAGAMSNKTLNSLEKALEQESSGIIVVLEDTKKEIEKLLDRQPNIQDKFNARIDIAELNNDALVAHGKEYALDMEYAIDELGVLALYTRIAEMQTSEHAVNIREVEEIVDEAIHHANKKNLSHLRDILFAKRYDDEDMVILRERDFITY